MKFKLILVAAFLTLATSVSAKELHPDPYAVLNNGKIISYGVNGNNYSEIVVSYKGEILVCRLWDSKYKCWSPTPKT